MSLKNLKKQLRNYVTFNPFNWLRGSRRLETMVDEWIASSPTTHVHDSDEKHFAIMVTTWLGTIVPWYSIVVGLLLAGRGANVVFVFDDLPFGKNPYRSAFIRATIRRVLTKIAARHTVLILSDFLRGESIIMPSAMLIDRMATLNAVHALRGEMMHAGRAEYIALVRQQLAIADPAIQRLIQQHSFDVIFIPGGIFGTSGLWREWATNAGVRVASHDAGGYGTVLLATDGIAAQLQDVPKAFSRLKTEVSTRQEDAFILHCANTELEKRHQGKDAFASQKAATSAGPLDRYRGAVLLALNSSWDQAALGLHTVFGTNSNWILETLQWVVEHTVATVVVRQHPSERLEVASTTDDYAGFLRHHFGTHDRVLFIGANDPINTYELLAVVSTVIAYTSTIGVEAAALGKHVIVPSSCYYASLGFVWDANSRADYFNLIRRSLAGELIISPEMRRDAVYCYYVAQVCNWIFSPFSPESYSLWSKESIASLNVNSTVQVILSALQDNIPAALINHRIKFKAYASLDEENDDVV